jgi:hypothetical protein
MTERLAPLTMECLSCRTTFTPRKAGHVFCSSFCRHRGERQPGEREQADPGAIARLFDEDRDPNEPVRPDDWHPEPLGSELRVLDEEFGLAGTVADRRRWYGNLRREGLI